MKRAEGRYSTGTGSLYIDVWQQRVTDAEGSLLPAHRPKRVGSHGDEDILEPTRVVLMRYRDTLLRNRKRIIGICPQCGQVFNREGQANTWNPVQET